MIWHANRPELWVPFWFSDATTDPLIYSLDYWQKVGEDEYAQNPVRDRGRSGTSATSKAQNWNMNGHSKTTGASILISTR